MATVQRVGEAAAAGLADAGMVGQVHLAGPTAQTIGLRDVTQSDFRRVAILALAIISVIVIALLRDIWLSVFMVAATVLGYFATLGLTWWAFSALGAGRLDWEVQVFLFIVLVAVGQDYNIFFTVRLAQESRQRRNQAVFFMPLTDAVAHTLVNTGRVISSCGIIMAATLGSLMAGDLAMFRQLGFALALGMLIDTFIVRPLLLPAFILLTGRSLRRAARLIH
jgi:RND superfamily putative drug exporter